MTLDIVNDRNEKVGTLEVSDALLGGRVNAAVIWESVVHQNAAERRGTHATKNRALVSGSGRKPWRQKGTGRARVGEIRNPLWRKGGTVFGPQPRDYGYQLPRKVDRAGVRAALAARAAEHAVIVIEQFPAETVKTKQVREMLRRLGSDGQTLLVDVTTPETFARAVRNLADARLVTTGRVTARDVLDAPRVIVTREAMERFQQTLAGGQQ
jgi:large subunit ribosomal protein L4